MCWLPVAHNPVKLKSQNYQCWTMILLYPRHTSRCSIQNHTSFHVNYIGGGHCQSMKSSEPVCRFVISSCSRCNKRQTEKSQNFQSCHMILIQISKNRCRFTLSTRWRAPPKYKIFRACLSIHDFHWFTV